MTIHNINGVKVHTSFDYPPIPIRSMDWSAVTDNYDCDCDQDGFFSTNPVGRGATEQEAIADLLEQLEEQGTPAVTVTAEPLAQWLNSAFAKTDDLMASLNCYRFQSKDDVMDFLGIDYGDVLLMAQIATRLQLVASNIDSRETPKFKLVQKNG